MMQNMLMMGSLCTRAVSRKHTKYHHFYPAAAGRPSCLFTASLGPFP